MAHEPWLKTQDRPPPRLQMSNRGQNSAISHCPHANSPVYALTSGFRHRIPLALPALPWPPGARPPPFLCQGTSLPAPDLPMAQGHLVPEPGFLQCPQMHRPLPQPCVLQSPSLTPWVQRPTASSQPCVLHLQHSPERTTGPDSSSLRWSPRPMAPALPLLLKQAVLDFLL